MLQMEAHGIIPVLSSAEGPGLTWMPIKYLSTIQQMLS